MKITIKHAELEKTEEGEYFGRVHFEVEQHKQPYEILFHSKERIDWGYSLHFLNESGPEEEIDAVDQYLEENEEAFDMLLDAVEQLMK